MTEPSVEIERGIGDALRAALECLADAGRLPLDELRRRCSWESTHEPAVLGALERLGVHVDAQTAWLDDDIEVLSEPDVRSRISRTTASWLRELNVLLLTDSTNTRMMARAANESVDGLVYLAEAQTAGRGRRGRHWLSPFARNIALSAGIRLPLPASELAPLSLVVGLAVVDTLVTLEFPGIALKWPNDVMLEGRKLGGILIELARMEPAASEVVIGVGLNVALSPWLSARVGQPAAALDDAGPKLGRNALAAALIGSIHAYAARFVRAGFTAMRDAWCQYDLYRGHRVQVHAGDQSIDGLVLGIDDRGGLLLETETGVRTFTGGEISMRPVAEP